MLGLVDRVGLEPKVPRSGVRNPRSDTPDHVLRTVPADIEPCRRKMQHVDLHRDGLRDARVSRMHRLTRACLATLSSVALATSLLLSGAPSASAAPGKNIRILTVGGVTTVCLQGDTRYNSIYLRSCNLSADRTWWTTSKVGSYYQITQNVSGKRLDSNSKGSVYLHAKNTGHNQQWLAEDKGGGKYRLKNRATGLCLNNNYWTGAVSAKKCSSSEDQLWKL